MGTSTTDTGTGGVGGSEQAADEWRAAAFRLDKRVADDAVQTTLLRLAEHLHTLREPERIGVWLVKTLRVHSSCAKRTCNV